jgi:hypothetical protein
VSDQETELEKFLEQAPGMRKWVYECASCHHRGYKSAMPESKYDSTVSTVTKLRRLLREMTLDETGVCEQCRQARETEDSPIPASKLSPQRIPCPEQERLDAAYRNAQRAAEEAESRLGVELVSAEPSVKRRARSELQSARRHSGQVRKELMAHSKKHGCAS